MLMVLKIIVFELVTGISVSYGKNTCDRSSTCYKAVLKFEIQLSDMIHNSICLILIEH